ncbi:MAG: hypothetical protein PHP48_10730 [Bacteroidales bacterium]|nr:hypothetical protein [Bacteroidales bacterium]
MKIKNEETKERYVAKLLHEYLETEGLLYPRSVHTMQSYREKHPIPKPAPSDLPDPMELVRKHSKRKF